MAIESPVEREREAQAEAYFARAKWPFGFRCSRCGHRHACVIRTRRLALYQCSACRYQSTVTSGTILEKSRTPLWKWAKAIQLLSQQGGVNAVQLAALIQVSYKTAWTILHKIRRAINEAESRRKLTGFVQAGLMHYGSPNLQPFTRHPQEHAIIVAQGSGEEDRPAIKLVRMPWRFFEQKNFITREGDRYFRTRYLREDAFYPGLIGKFQLYWFPHLKEAFRQAKRWMNRTFHGIGAKYQQLYWDEFCFRWNLFMNWIPVERELTALCVRPHDRSVA